MTTANLADFIRNMPPTPEMIAVTDAHRTSRMRIAAGNIIELEAAHELANNVAFAFMGKRDMNAPETYHAIAMEMVSHRRRTYGDPCWKLMAHRTAQRLVAVLVEAWER